MNFISDTLYWLSTGLLVPVIMLLIFFFGRALLLIGCFFGQYLSIQRTASLLRKELDGLTKDNVMTLSESLPRKNTSLVVTYMNQLLKAQNSAQRQRLLASFEIEADKDLSISKTLGKMGPMLGLMGTLIPMGPALVGLSTGNIASMAYNMQVAFATTVVGLFAAAIGFVTQQMKQRWYLQDMTNLEYVAQLLNEN
ncbi:MAG: MotA/TolQ/ExbB proton channel family protein [Paramuribaculum sp.]|nr:MotA/TolQ/ExbB proton channel family protein [Paramuribaculum sp.]